MTESTTGEYLESVTCPSCDTSDCVIELPYIYPHSSRTRMKCENCNYEWFEGEPLTEDDEDD